MCAARVGARYARFARDKLKRDVNVKQAVPFFSVNDMERSTRFYIDGLGFTMTKNWIDNGKLRWCWLELGGAALMLQEFWKEGPHRNVPSEKVGVGVSINSSAKTRSPCIANSARAVSTRNGRSSATVCGSRRSPIRTATTSFSRARPRRWRRLCTGRPDDGMTGVPTHRHPVIPSPSVTPA